MSNEGPQRDVTERRFQANARWVCGHSHLGFACSMGPSSNGKCGNQHKACKHDEATNRESACGSCELACHKRAVADESQSPWEECESLATTPCIPVRTAWGFRGTLALNLAIATAGILLCLLVFPQREATFVPGGLSSKHAQILENRLVSERCSLCHPNVHTLSPTNGEVATQDELCARCHDGHLPKLHLRSPHDMDRQALRELTLSALNDRGILVSKKSKLSEGQADSASDNNGLKVSPEFASLLATSDIETKCASCHVEHHGRNNDLKAISDEGCNTCHAKQFKAFGSGHPEFDNYPARQPRRIAFTHQAHLETHFAKKNETFDCTKCHVDSNQRGGVGSVFRTLSFEAACARCHEESINAATIDGWVLLQLPSITPGDVQQSGLELTDWPTTAQFGYEGTIPLAMRALLMADSGIQNALGRLPESGDLKSIENFDKTGRDTTISLAVATRALIRDIATNGQVAWRNRLETTLTQSLARGLSFDETKLLDELCAGLPPDIFRQMQQNWFGDDSEKIVRNQNSILGGQVAQLVSAQDDELLLDSASNTENDEGLLGNSREANSPMPKEVGPLAESDEDLLLGNGSKSAAPPKRQQLTKLRGAVHVAQGGWYLDNDTLSLRYMPRGHNDPTLAAWAEFAMLLTHATNDAQVEDASAIHVRLSRQVPGGCTQCHVLGTAGISSTMSPSTRSHQTRSHQTRSPWTAVSKSATAKAITKFDHTPHLTLPSLVDCKYCHQLDTKGNAKSLSMLTAASFKSGEGQLDQSACEFRSMHLEQCSACHRPNAASTGCTQCHNYHVTEPHSRE